jgi:hypothetical protein
MPMGSSTAARRTCSMGTPAAPERTVSAPGLSGPRASWSVPPTVCVAEVSGSPRVTAAPRQRAGGVEPAERGAERLARSGAGAQIVGDEPTARWCRRRRARAW